MNTTAKAIVKRVVASTAVRLATVGVIALTGVLVGSVAAAQTEPPVGYDYYQAQAAAQARAFAQAQAPGQAQGQQSLPPPELEPPPSAPAAAAEEQAPWDAQTQGPELGYPGAVEAAPDPQMNPYQQYQYPPYDADPRSSADVGADFAPDQAIAESYDDGYDPNAYAQFQSSLAPYGSWVDDASYGRVWVPATNIVGADFVPYYTNGHWVLSEYGWTWVSNWGWGWAPFHYGRWMPITGRGWCWVPGTMWGPSWVAWRSGGGYVGWAPLPPRGAGFPRVVAGPHAAWHFTLATRLGDARPSYVPARSVPMLLARTTVVANDRLLSRGAFTVHVNAGPIHGTNARALRLASVAPAILPRIAVAPHAGEPIAARPWARTPVVQAQGVNARRPGPYAPGGPASYRGFRSTTGSAAAETTATTLPRPSSTATASFALHSPVISRAPSPMTARAAITAAPAYHAPAPRVVPQFPRSSSSQPPPVPFHAPAPAFRPAFAQPQTAPAFRAPAPAFRAPAFGAPPPAFHAPPAPAAVQPRPTPVTFRPAPNQAPAFHSSPSSFAPQPTRFSSPPPESRGGGNRGGGSWRR